jgi:hypothetical protein
MKILKTMSDLKEKDDEDFIPEVIVRDNKSIIYLIKKASAKSYLQFFEWDDSQYLLNKPIIETTERIYKKALKFDEELKIKVQEYSTLKSSITGIDRKVG